MDNWCADGVSITWDFFIGDFLNMFFPKDIMEAKDHDFINLRQGSISLQQYGIKSKREGIRL